MMDAQVIVMRLKEMAIAYQQGCIGHIDWANQIATVVLYPLDPNRSGRLKRKFSVQGHTLRFLGETSNMRKPFRKSEHPITRIWLNGTPFYRHRGKFI
jgi:hypothetical protein